jgi:mannobiose 2-epimerase
MGTLCCLLAVLWLPIAASAAAKGKAEYARDFQAQLTKHVLPYWLRTLDPQNGGFLLADDGTGKGTARDKQLVSQARMVWGFAHAHLHGLTGRRRDCLRAAENGYRFLLDHFRDAEHGGYFWKTDLAGQPINDCKFLYGQAFVIYAFVEYHRATRDPQALAHAMDLYHAIQRHCHDAQHGGWIEHTERDWTPLQPGDRRNEVEVVGYRSANAHLHWMEALTELYAETRDRDVRRSLIEALDLNQRYFYPREPGKSCFHRQPDWSEVTDPASAGLSYGHNVEFAWLMIRAERALRRRPSWSHFHAHLRHALEHGYDHARGGLYHRGVDDQPATDTDKIWWVQAEMLAALTEGLGHSRDRAYSAALDSLLTFLVQHQIDPDDGIWLDTVAADGTPKRRAKAHNWKANYHDLRALVKFIEAFGRR